MIHNTFGDYRDGVSLYVQARPFSSVLTPPAGSGTKDLCTKRVIRRTWPKMPSQGTRYTICPSENKQYLLLSGTLNSSKWQIIPNYLPAQLIQSITKWWLTPFPALFNPSLDKKQKLSILLVNPTKMDRIQNTTQKELVLLITIFSPSRYSQYIHKPTNRRSSSGWASLYHITILIVGGGIFEIRFSDSDRC